MHEELQPVQMARSITGIDEDRGDKCSAHDCSQSTAEADGNLVIIFRGILQ